MMGYWGRWNITTVNSPYSFSAGRAKLCPFTFLNSTLLTAAVNPKGLICQPEQELSDSQGLWSGCDAAQNLPAP